MKALVDAGGQTVGVFAEVLVLADRYRCDGADYFVAVFGACQVVDAPPPVSRVDRAELAAQVESAVQGVYSRYSAAQLEEYKEREAEAAAYQAAPAGGPYPAAPRVQGFADAQGITLPAAAQVTLAQAAQLRGALAQLADIRMKKRYVARPDVADDEAAQTCAQALITVAAIAAAIA